MQLIGSDISAVFPTASIDSVQSRLRHVLKTGEGATFEFECGTGGHDGGCWCMDQTSRLPMPSAGSADCLCPACLHAALQSAARSA